MTYDGSTAPLSTPLSTRKSIGTRASIYADDPGEALVCRLSVVTGGDFGGCVVGPAFRTPQGVKVRISRQFFLLGLPTDICQQIAADAVNEYRVSACAFAFLLGASVGLMCSGVA
jgi:hypothetical protein